MKRINAWLVVFALFAMLFSCNSSNEDPKPGDDGGTGGGGTPTDTTGTGGGGGGDNGGDGNPFGAPPASFRQKMVIEEGTGTWCGWCPFGTYYMGKMIEDHDGRVIGVAFHAGDPMEVTRITDYLGGGYNLVGYPSGMLNRLRFGRDYFLHPVEWEEYGLPVLKNNPTTSIGLALDTEHEAGKRNFSADVYVGYGQNPPIDEYSLVVYLIEDGITGYPQENYLSGNANFREYPYYSQPARITNFVHNHVLRDALTPLDGTAIDWRTIKAGGTTKVSISGEIDLTKIVDTNCYLVAMLTKIGDGGKPEIVNAQKVKLGQDKGWD
jgi:hypothetical protein